MTEVPPEMVQELLTDMEPRYRPQDYNLLFHNCNHFSNELCLLLCGEGIPVSSSSSRASAFILHMVNCCDKGTTKRWLRLQSAFSARLASNTFILVLYIARA